MRAFKTRRIKHKWKWAGQCVLNTVSVILASNLIQFALFVTRPQRAVFRMFNALFNVSTARIQLSRVRWHQMHFVKPLSTGFSLRSLRALCCVPRFFYLENLRLIRFEVSLETLCPPLVCVRFFGCYLITWKKLKNRLPEYFFFFYFE